MKIEDLVKGMYVEDTWFSFHDGTYSEPWGKGVVSHITKTRAVVIFEHAEKVVYDKQHVQFLEPCHDTSEFTKI